MDDQHKYLSLRTFRRTGTPVDTPVWFAAGESGHIYIFSADNAGKVKRLRNSEAAEIATCDARGGNVGTWEACKAFLVDSSDEQAMAYRQLRRKYGWQMKITDFFSRLSGRINKRAVIRIETG